MAVPSDSSIISKEHLIKIPYEVVHLNSSISTQMAIIIKSDNNKIKSDGKVKLYSECAVDMNWLGAVCKRSV